MHLAFYIQLFFKKDFIYLRERESVNGGRGRGRGRKRLLSRLHTQHGAQQRAPSHNPEIMT